MPRQNPGYRGCSDFDPLRRVVVYHDLMVFSARVTVQTTPTQLNSVSDNSDLGYGIAVRNRGASAIYLGAAGVTTSTGYQLDAGESVSFDVRSSDALYAIAASGTVRVDVLATGVA